jgi:predicted DCC family thiol-disulfide oxidoreductase YuxK
VTEPAARATTPSTLFVFDGDCGFCSSWVRVLERSLPRFPTAVPSQWADLDALGLTPDDVAHNSWFITPTHQYAGHLAFSALLRAQPSAGLRFAGHLIATPPFSWVVALAYRAIGATRYRLPGGTPAVRVPRADGDRG